MHKYKGAVSSSGRKQISDALEYWLMVAPYKWSTSFKTGKKYRFKLSFVTLTLPSRQRHTDQEIKSKVLKNWLDVMRKQYGLKNYLWRAEAQTNGNIHFHIVIDKYIHYSELRRLWNQSAELLGYVTEFQNQFGHRDPNSTDVHSIKHIRHIARYLAKYCSKQRQFACVGELRKLGDKVFEVRYDSEQYKEEEGEKKKGKVIGHVLSAQLRKIEGRVWFLSKSLQAIKPIKVSEGDRLFEHAYHTSGSDLLTERGYDFGTAYYGNVLLASMKESDELFTSMVHNAGHLR